MPLRFHQVCVRGESNVGVVRQLFAAESPLVFGFVVGEADRRASQNLERCNGLKSPPGLCVKGVNTGVGASAVRGAWP